MEEWLLEEEGCFLWVGLGGRVKGTNYVLFHLSHCGTVLLWSARLEVIANLSRNESVLFCLY